MGSEKPSKKEDLQQNVQCMPVTCDFSPLQADKGNTDKGGGKKPKKKKDPNAPKRNMSSYMFFSNAMRSKVRRV